MHIELSHTRNLFFFFAPKQGNYDAKSGMKWSLRSLKLFMISKHGEASVNSLFNSIQMLIIQSIQSVQSILIQDKHCFELYGYEPLRTQKRIFVPLTWQYISGECAENYSWRIYFPWTATT